MNIPKDAKRQEIKDRIATAQARNESRGEATLTELVSEKAIEARDGFTSFAKEHPVITVAGGVALGVLVSSMFRNSPTRRAGRAAGAKAAGLAALASEMAMAFAQQAMEASADVRQAGADRIEDMGDALGDTARGLKRTANFRAAGAGDTARSTARNVGKTIARSLRRH